MIEITEKLLLALGGWEVWKEARALHAAGRVLEAVYAYPDLKGKVQQGDRQAMAGLHFRSASDVDNLCWCKDSKVRGLVCAHSLAVGLHMIHPNKPAVSEASKSSTISQTVSSSNRAVTPSKAQQETSEEPVVELQLEGSLRHLEASVAFHYKAPGVANFKKEQEVLTLLLKLGFQPWKGTAAIQGEDAVLNFFANDLPGLKKTWKVTEGERFQTVTKGLVPIEPLYRLQQREDGWLDFQVHYQAGKEAIFSHADLQSLLRTGQKQMRLKDGRIAVANAAMVQELEEVLHDCNPQQERGGYRIPASCQSYLEASLALQEKEQKAHALSENHLGSLRQKLRPYQRHGALWLLERAKRKLGGLLADEMGLGKTVQTLAMVEVLAGPVLVVCPSSLVWNWKREAENFLPGLSVLALNGPQRMKLFSKISEYQLLITSYALLRRDLDHYKNIDLKAVILDEAQHIKNPDSQNAKAACALKAQSRFILTGTPIENSIRDLWSLFEFILPGYLGSRSDFRDRYEAPLLQGEKGGLWSRLFRRVQPYLLRRKKQEILTDLPDKIEQVVEVELTDEQKAVYSRLQQVARSQIDQLQEAGQQGGARMQVLTALLRLRQACCDLRLLGMPMPKEERKGRTKKESCNSEDADQQMLELGASAKLAALLELLEEAMDGGHRVLVFSQFTSMLDLIAGALHKQDIVYCRLDGSTKNREGVVRQFQETGNIPVFLISLKAGGVGLNLTAADIVIHFDPWWNPAAEAQATDRAHRIGQKNVVTSIKLIARDTVEERVLAFQKKKQGLVAEMIDAEGGGEWLSPEELKEIVG